MISAEHLTRQYGSFTAVDDVSFEVGDGEIVGLLGHNGAGKTTIMKMLTGYLEPTAGTATIHGHDIGTQRRQAQALIGYLPENCPLYPEMTVVEFLDYAAELRGIPPGARAQALRDAIAATGLGEKATAPIASLSRGYRQRTGVAQAILHKPKIVILDEPTNGLDPSQIAQMRGLIRDLAKTATVILSTHILQEVRAVCERVLLINRGRLALDTRMSDLGGPGRLRLVTSGPPELVERLVTGLGLVKSVERLTAAEPGHAYALNLNGHAASTVAPAVARVITDNKLDLFALHPEQRDLETLFADITGAGAPTREALHA